MALYHLTNPRLITYSKVEFFPPSGSLTIKTSITGLTPLNLNYRDLDLVILQTFPKPGSTRQTSAAGHKLLNLQ